MNETAEERALSFLGLCMRAGQVVSGQEACVAAIRGGECALALLDAGASAGTRKKISDACAYRNVPLHILPEGEIDRACGREGRMVAAVKPGALCAQMMRMLPNRETDSQ